MTGSVLIVEDEVNIAVALEFLLQRAGFSVEVVGDGDAAAEALARRPPDVVLLDVMLPKHSGFEILRMIRKQPALADLPVLVLTARGQSRDRRTAEDAGADIFLTKPFANDEVVAAVRRLATEGRSQAGGAQAGASHDASETRPDE